jgi:hypothetical protein
MSSSKSVLLAAAVGILLTASPVAWSQTSSQALTADPRAHYQAIRQILEALIEQEDQKSKREDERQMAELRRNDPAEWRKAQANRREWERRIDLYSCRAGGDFLSDNGNPDNDLLVAMSQLATDTIDLARLLQKFPRQIWEGPARNFEAQELGRIVAERTLPQDYQDKREALLKALEPPLNAARRANASLPQVTVDGGCGAGDISVNIETDPPGGQVLFIPTFFYELCKAQKLSPDDTERCNHWREAVSGAISSVSGDYVYVARWPDGATRRGKLSISPGQDGSTIRLGKR